MEPKYQCYFLYSYVNNKCYIGFTNNFSRRFRQHNGEIKGGAKYTEKYKPWKPVCQIFGFTDKSTALRFEYRLQRPPKHLRKLPLLKRYLTTLEYLIKNRDGKFPNKKDWPPLVIVWYDNNYSITCDNVTNIYHT